MGDFSAQPKPQNKNSKIIMLIFFGIALITAVISVFMSSHRGLVGMVTLGSLTTAILMYTKYVSVTFYYDIMVTGLEEPLLVVRQAVGKRNVTLARVALADIISITRETREERRQYKREKGIILYNYGPTLSPSVTYRLQIRGYNEKADIVLEGTDEFFDKIREIAASARKMREDSEEY